MKKKVLIISGSIVAFILVCFLFIQFSVWPTTWLVRSVFSQGSFSEKSDFQEIKNKVDISADLVYGDSKKNEYYDYMKPREKVEAKGVVVWVHGGAFVASDKVDSFQYSVILANEGYDVFNINYELAPNMKYPGQLLQIDSFFKYLYDNEEKFDLNMKNIIIGGDSAGAHMVSQYANIQVNSEYSKLVSIKPTIKVGSIKGLILFCGPYNLSRFKDVDSGLLGFFLNKVAVAYLGDGKWKSNDKYDALSIVNYINSDYPSVFLTDGNTMSFMEHSIDFEKSLYKNGVYFESLYFSLDDAELGHEYQFNLAEAHALVILERVKGFMEERINE